MNTFNEEVKLKNNNNEKNIIDKISKIFLVYLLSLKNYINSHFLSLFLEILKMYNISIFWK